MAEDKEQKDTEKEVEDPKRVHFLTIRLDEKTNRIVGDITGVSELEAVKMLEGVLEVMDCNMPEVVVMRDGKVAYSSTEDDDDEED